MSPVYRKLNNLPSYLWAFPSVTEAVEVRSLPQSDMGEQSAPNQTSLGFVVSAIFNFDIDSAIMIS